jgi:hypothetical protein
LNSRKARTIAKANTGMYTSEGLTQWRNHNHKQLDLELEPEFFFERFRRERKREHDETNIENESTRTISESASRAETRFAGISTTQVLESQPSTQYTLLFKYEPPNP